MPRKKTLEPDQSHQSAILEIGLRSNFFSFWDIYYIYLFY